MSKAEWPNEEEARADIADRMHGNDALARWSDHRQKLVSIGTDLDEAVSITQLDACLLTDAGVAAGPRAWVALADPFPA